LEVHAVSRGDGSRDDVEKVLVEAKSLIQSAVSRHRNRRSQRQVVPLPPASAQLRLIAARLASQAREDLACVIPASSFSETGLNLVLTTLAAANAQGVRCRVLCTPESTETQRGTSFMESIPPGVQVRIAHGPLEELLIVDTSKALVRTTLGPTGKQAFLLYESAVVNSLYLLWNCTWRLAVSPAEFTGLRIPTERAQRILQCLGTGQTDDAAARTLGVSVRTYRRQVAQIMQDLGVTARFQAGVRASRLGLLSLDAPRSHTRISL
jgi:DNA-binding CsgD family transcriptional regulator